MTKTTFRIAKIGDTYTVFDNDVILILGFPTIGFTLHGLWVCLGTVESDWYSCLDNGDVILSKSK